MDCLWCQDIWDHYNGAGYLNIEGCIVQEYISKCFFKINGHTKHILRSMGLRISLPPSFQFGLYQFLLRNVSAYTACWQLTNICFYIFPLCTHNPTVFCLGKAGYGRAGIRINHCQCGWCNTSCMIHKEWFCGFKCSYFMNEMHYKFPHLEYLYSCGVEMFGLFVHNDIQ